MNAHLQLLFHADHLKFCLVRELDDWRHEFNKLRDALSFAKSEGAKELPFLVVDEGELFSECVISVDPKERNQMISNSEELAAFVAHTVQARGSCRIFSNVLARCWHVPAPQWEELVKRFAAEHGWLVELHEPAGYGIVADFRPFRGN